LIILIISSLEPVTTSPDSATDAAGAPQPSQRHVGAHLHGDASREPKRRHDDREPATTARAITAGWLLEHQKCSLLSNRTISSTSCCVK